MLRTDFNKKLGVELYKKAAYLDNKPKTRQALIKVARAIYNGRDASFAIRTYFQPKQRKQAADVVNCVAHRIKKTGAASTAIAPYVGKVLPAAEAAGKRWGGKALDRILGWGGKAWGSKVGKGVIGGAGAGGVYRIGKHVGGVDAAEALEARDKQIAEELNKQLSQYNGQRPGLTAQGAGGASGTILDRLQGAGNSALDWIKNNPGKSVGIGTAAVGLPLLLSYLNRRRRRDDD